MSTPELKPFCVVRLNRNGEAGDIAEDEQSAEMWAYGVEALYTEDQMRAYAAAYAESALNAAREALGELLKLRKNCEGDIGWRGKPSAIVDNIRVRHILLIESALAQIENSSPQTTEKPNHQ